MNEEQMTKETVNAAQMYIKAQCYQPPISKEIKELIDDASFRAYQVGARLGREQERRTRAEFLNKLKANELVALQSDLQDVASEAMENQSTIQ